MTARPRTPNTPDTPTTATKKSRKRRPAATRPATAVETPVLAPEPVVEKPEPETPALTTAAAIADGAQVRSKDGTPDAIGVVIATNAKGCYKVEWPAATGKGGKRWPSRWFRPESLERLAS